MFCANCGNEILGEGAFCPVCGSPSANLPRVVDIPPRPENNIVWAVIATLLCFLPTGLAALVYASRVDGKYNAGDYEGALEFSEKAETFSIVSFLVLPASMLIGLLHLIFSSVK